MSTGTFDKKIDDICIKMNENMMLVVKNAIRKVVIEAQRPLNQGGKMHVDTGFLRWSGTASLNELPYGETEGRQRNKDEKGVLAEYRVSNDGGKMLNTVLAQMKLGDTFYFGWTARYAIYRELYDGFMGSAVMNLQKHINDEARRLK